MIPHQNFWSDAPERPFRAHGEAHVWRAHLNQDSSTVQSFANVLSGDEHQRAARYHFQRDREHYIVTRGILRTILSRYLNRSPRQLRFLYNGYGKPALKHGVGDDPLRFNVSHTHAIALYAVTWEREIGIDIEFVREDFATVEIAKRFFSPCSGRSPMIRHYCVLQLLDAQGGIYKGSR